MEPRRVLPSDRYTAVNWDNLEVKADASLEETLTINQPNGKRIA
jgi:hypothetical protein